MLTNRAIAPTTFLTGPDENLATADVYEISNDDVINNLPSPVSVDTDSLANELRGGNSLIKDLPMLTSDEIRAKADIATPWEVVKDKASSSIGGLKASVAGDGKGFLDTLKNMGSSVYNALGGVNGIKTILNSSGPSLLSRVSTGTLGIPGLAGNNQLSSLATVLSGKGTPQAMQALLTSPIPSQLGAYATANGVTSRLPSGNLTQSYQFGSLLNNVVPSGSSVNVVDKDSTARLISAFAVGGMSSGVPNAFSSVMPLANNDTAILAKSAQVAMNYASGTGNIHGMKDVVTAVGPSNIIGMGKTVFSNFSKSYSADTSTSSPKQDFATVTDTFHKIDPDWMHAPSNPNLGYEVVDLSMGFEGSSDFKNMMATGAKTTDDNNLKCFAMTNMFDVKPPEQALAAQFPMTYTEISTRTTPDVQTTTRDKDGYVLNSKGQRIIDLPNTDPDAYTSELEYLRANTTLT